ncbi:hypothetical protein VdG2_04860 [Verticillium dahliae VDG2]|nr:hypothetical protein VdG2_04860 [Verticillium dahliae VDG2]
MSMPGAFSPHAPSSPKMAPTATASSAAASSASAGDVKKPDAFLTPPLRLGESSDAYSLHSANANANANAPGRFYDDDPAELLPGRGGDEDDLPPLYTDDPSADGVRDPLLQIQDLHSKQHGLVPPHLVVPDTGNEYHIDRRLDADPSFLQRHIEACAAIPPRAFVRLRGTHTEPVRRGDKTERQTHVDFDVRLELTPFLYSDIATHTSWRTLRTADNFAKVRRGTGTLDQGDLVAAEGAQGATFDGQTEAQAVVGNAVGNFVRAGVSAMNAVNVRFGWGGDH